MTDFTSDIRSLNRLLSTCFTNIESTLANYSAVSLKLSSTVIEEWLLEGLIAVSTCEVASISTLFIDPARFEEF